MTVKSLTLIGAIIVPLLGSAAVEAQTPARAAHVGLPELVLNLRTGRALGLKIPPQISGRADEVIQ